MSTNTISLKTLSTLRMLIGASCVLLPRQAGALWGVPLAAGPESVLFGRMVGVRDFVLGAYLWRRAGEWETSRKMQGTGVRTGLLAKSSSPSTEHGARGTEQTTSPAFVPGTATLDDDHAMSNVRSALWLGLVCDAVDLASVGMCWVEGSPISGLGEFCIGGGAAMFVAIAGQFLLASRRV